MLLFLPLPAGLIGCFVCGVRTRSAIPHKARYRYIGIKESIVLMTLNLPQSSLSSSRQQDVRRILNARHHDPFVVVTEIIVAIAVLDDQLFRLAASVICNPCRKEAQWSRT